LSPSAAVVEAAGAAGFELVVGKGSQFTLTVRVLTFGGGLVQLPLKTKPVTKQMKLQSTNTHSKSDKENPASSLPSGIARCALRIGTSRWSDQSAKPFS